MAGHTGYAARYEFGESTDGQMTRKNNGASTNGGYCNFHRSSVDRAVSSRREDSSSNSKETDTSDETNSRH